MLISTTAIRMVTSSLLKQYRYKPFSKQRRSHSDKSSSSGQVGRSYSLSVHGKIKSATHKQSQVPPPPLWPAQQPRFDDSPGKLFGHGGSQLVSKPALHVKGVPLFGGRGGGQISLRISAAVCGFGPSLCVFHPIWKFGGGPKAALKGLGHKLLVKLSTLGSPWYIACSFGSRDEWIRCRGTEFFQRQRRLLPPSVATPHQVHHPHQIRRHRLLRGLPYGWLPMLLQAAAQGAPKRGRRRPGGAAGPNPCMRHPPSPPPPKF